MLGHILMFIGKSEANILLGFSGLDRKRIIMGIAD